MDRLGSDVLPVVFVTAHRLTAFDAESGRHLYSVPLELPPAKGPTRLARYRDDWVVAHGRSVVTIEAARGNVTGRFQLTFAVRTLLAHHGYLIFAGEGGTACYRDGALRWSSRHDWTDATATDAAGNVVAQLPLFTAQQIGIGMGDAIAQGES